MKVYSKCPNIGAKAPHMFEHPKIVPNPLPRCLLQTVGARARIYDTEPVAASNFPPASKSLLKHNYINLTCFYFSLNVERAVEIIVIPLHMLQKYRFSLTSPTESFHTSTWLPCSICRGERPAAEAKREPIKPNP